MSDKPFFSIIIPMYNAEHYIKICINSILVQTFQDFEIIIIDDCSTDNSYKLCQELYGNNEKVRLLQHEKNQGQGPARNTGIENAYGEYIWFVDNDDAIIPVALEKIHKVIQSKNGLDTIHFLWHYETLQDDDKPLDFSKITLSTENRSGGLLNQNIVQRLAEHFAINRIWFMTWTDCYRKSFLFEHNIKFHDILAEDSLVHFKAICFSHKYLMFNESVYINRQRKSSVSRSPNFKNCSKSIKSMPLICLEMENVMKQFPELSQHRFLREQCIIQLFDSLLRDHARPLYDGVHIPIELDKAVYETMLPIFGENTTLVKYLFHGFNNMWRQANVLGYQNYLLRQKDDLLKQQNKLIEQMNKLLEQQNRQLQQLKNM